MFKIYKLKEEYSAFLKKYDNKVPMNKNEARPYIGVLLEINDKIKYFAPLSSPKLKHRNMKAQVDFIKIDGGTLGIINLNNAIPIKEKDLIIIDINKLKNSKDVNERKYGNLCDDQLFWCNLNRVNIQKKFEKLYNLFMENKLSKNIKERCCDFKLLEEKCLEYSKLSKLNKETLINIQTNKSKEKIEEIDDNKSSKLKMLVKEVINKGIDKNNYNVLTGNEILTRNHSSGDKRWIAMADIKDNNIPIKDNQNSTLTIVLYDENEKLHASPIEYYNVSQLEISKELEQKFVPMKEKDKNVEKSKDREIER